jgi:hypothetical protein
VNDDVDVHPLRPKFALREQNSLLGTNLNLKKLAAGFGLPAGNCHHYWNVQRRKFTVRAVQNIK